MPEQLRKEGKHYQFDDLEWWAEDGLIFIEDRRDGTFKIDTCDDFKQRALAVNQAAKREYERGKYPDEHKRLTDCVCNMRDAWKEAVDQGNPADPVVAAQKYRERRRSLRASMLMPNTSCEHSASEPKMLLSGLPTNQKQKLILSGF